MTGLTCNLLYLQLPFLSQSFPHKHHKPTRSFVTSGLLVLNIIWEEVKKRERGFASSHSNTTKHLEKGRSSSLYSINTACSSHFAVPFPFSKQQDCKPACTRSSRKFSVLQCALESRRWSPLAH